MQNNANQQENDWTEQALSRLYSAQASEDFETAWRAAVRREESIQMTNQPMKKHRFWRVAAPVLTALVLVLGSLWASTQPFPPNPTMLNEQPLSDGELGARTQSGELLVGNASSADATPEMANYAMVDGASAPMPNSFRGKGLAAQGEAPQSAGQKLVRTASTTLHSTAFDADSERVKALLSELGGYVENLYSYGDIQNGDTRTVNYSMRVPSEQLDRFLSGINGIGRTTDYSESTTDMSVEYADNDARLATLKAKMTRLDELLKQAENVADLIEIENAIADTQYQIDSYETSQRGIDRQVNMSAVTVTIKEETPAQSAAATDRSLSARVPAALKASMQWLGEFFRNMLVFVIMILPVLIPAVVIALIVWLCVVRRKRTGKAQTPKKPKED
ncbi:MAG: DUF4349 domain-containing protein [Clostridia bacterium]